MHSVVALSCVVVVATILCVASNVNAASVVAQQRRLKSNNGGGVPGTSRWNITTGSRGIYSSPTSTYHTLYIGSDDGSLYAVNKDTSHIIWQYQSHNPVQSTPTVCRSCGKQGMLFWGNNHGPQGFGDGGCMHSSGLAEGYLQWRYCTGGSITGRPYVYQSVLIYGSYDNTLYFADINTGRIRARFNTSGPISASPEVFNDVVVVGSFDGYIYGITPTGSLQWKYQTNGQVTSACVYSNPVIYCPSNDYSIYALDVNTGALVWKKSTGGPVQGRPAVRGGMVYVPSFDGNLYCFEAATGQQVWTFNTNSTLAGGVTVTDNQIVFGDMTGTLWNVFTNGTLNWNFVADGGIVTRPLIEDHIYFATLSGTIFSVYFY